MHAECHGDSWREFAPARLRYVGKCWACMRMVRVEVVTENFFFQNKRPVLLRLHQVIPGMVIHRGIMNTKHNQAGRQYKNNSDCRILFPHPLSSHLSSSLIPGFPLPSWHTGDGPTVLDLYWTTRLATSRRPRRWLGPSPSRSGIKNRLSGFSLVPLSLACPFNRALVCSAG